MLASKLQPELNPPDSQINNMSWCLPRWLPDGGAVLAGENQVQLKLPQIAELAVWVRSLGKTCESTCTKQNLPGCLPDRGRCACRRAPDTLGSAC